MILKCTSCAAPIDLSHLPPGNQVTEITCSSCGAVVPVPPTAGDVAIGSDVLATDQNSPRFQPATSTLDAPAPDEEFEFEPSLVDATRRPRDVLMAPGTQPLDRPLPLGEITATSSGRLPPPLPGQKPTATTTGMPAPSMVAAARGKAPPALPSRPAQKPAEKSVGSTGPKTGELASGSIAPNDVDLASVAPSYPNLQSGVGSLQQTSQDMPAILSAEPSLIEAVDHLTTGEIPQINVSPSPAPSPDFDDESPDDSDWSPGTAASTNARVSFLSGMVLSAVVAVGAYLVLDDSVEPVSEPSVEASEALTHVEQLMEAARFEDRDTQEARNRARTLYQDVLHSSKEDGPTELKTAALFGLARLDLAEVQYDVLKGSEDRTRLSSIEDRLRELEHPRAEILKIRAHRLAGQRELVRDALKRYQGPKSLEYRLERELSKAPTVKADPKERLKQLQRLQPDVQRSPTVWALTVDAALAAGDTTTAKKILEGAPRGPDRKGFLNKLMPKQPKVEEARPVETAPKTEDSVAVTPKKPSPSTARVPVEKKAKDTGAASVPPGKGLDFKATMSRGISLLERGDEERAEAMFQKAAEAKPNRPEPHTNLGYCAHSRKRYSKAVEHFQRALRLRGGYADALYGLGNAYRAMGRSEQARQTFRTYLDKYPGGQHARMARARLEELGQTP